MSQSFKLGSLLLLALTAVGCSKSNTQSVTINFPDWKQLHQASYQKQSLNSSQSASPDIKDAHIISINVGGKLINGFPWEAKDDGSSTPPSSVTFDAETGSLVQAFALLEANDGSRVYYYGDATVAGSGTLVVDLSNVATTTGGEGKVIGRYLTASSAALTGTGPTGVFQYRFDVSKTAGGAGKPSMVITTGEAFNGWINVTTLPSSLLIYTKPDGSPMFQLSSEGTSPLLSAVRMRRAARFIVPSSFKNEGGAGFDMRPNPPTEYVVGFFGPAADSYSQPTNGSVCYTNPPTDYTDAASIPDLYKDLAHTTLMKWAGDATVPPPLLPNYAQIIRGGAPTTDTTRCSGVNDFISRMSINDQRLKDGDEFMGLRGPFKLTAAGNDFVDSSYDSGTHKISLTWSLLPGAADVLAGMSIFYRQVADPNHDDGLKTMDGYNCQAMHDRVGAFAEFSEQMVGIGTTTTSLGDFTEPESHQVQAFVCPRGTDGTYYKSAVALRDNSGGNSNFGPATQIAVRAADSVVTSTGQRKSNGPTLCYPIKVETQDSQGHPAFMVAPAQLSLSTSHVNTSFYTQPTCPSGQGSVGSININGFNGNMTVYVLDNGTDENYQIDITASSFSTSYYATHTSAVLYSNIPKLEMILPSTIVAHSCVLVDFVLVDSAVTNILVGYNLSTVVDTPTHPNYAFYGANDWNCSGGTVPNLTMTNTTWRMNSVSGFMKYTGSAATNVNVTQFSATLGTPASLAKSVNVTAPGAVARVQITGAGSMEIGGCYQMNAQLQDSSNYASPYTGAANLPVTISSNTGFFYDDMNCGTVQATSKTMLVAPNQSVATGLVYFKPVMLSPTTLTASAAPFSSSSYAPTLAPATPRQIVMVYPGQYYSYGGKTRMGTPDYIDPNKPVHIKLYAVTSDGTVADGSGGMVVNFTDSVSSVMGTEGAISILSGSPTMFSNGVANIVVQFGSPWIGQIGMRTFQGTPPATAPNLAPAFLSATTSILDNPYRYQFYGSAASYQYGCQPSLLTYESSAGGSRINQSASSISLYFYNDSNSLSTSAAYGYGDPNCLTASAAGVGSVPQMVGARAQVIYRRFNAPLTGSNNARIEVSGAYAANAQSNLFADSTPPGSATNLKIYGPASPQVGVCTPYMVASEDVTGKSATPGAPQMISLTAMDGFTGQFFQDDSCEALNNFVTLQPADRVGVFYVRAMFATPGTIHADYAGYTVQGSQAVTPSP